ncbi:MAG: signal transduction histidine kinase [Crocinitomicaceae bacterium]
MIHNILHSFYSKLSFGLLVSFLLIGLLLMLIAQHLTQGYQNEVEQKLHLQLASHVVYDNALLKNGEIDITALKNTFHNMMILGPSFEFYLLDPQGNISTYSADPNRIKKSHVDLKPIQDFLSGNVNLPILGDDPRSMSNHKIFSVAPIYDGAILKGYLYIIIGGEIYDGIVQLFKSSHNATLAVWSLLVALVFGLISALLLFALLTRPLRRLTHDMHNFRKDGFKLSQLPPSKWQSDSADEIQRLGVTFNEMAGALNNQYQKIKSTDELRRELISYVSHDLRTPLASLQGYLETWQLKHRQLSVVESEQLINIAMKNAQHMSRLIEQLFELAHLDADDVTLSKEPLAIAELAQDVIIKLSLQAEKKGLHLKLLTKDISLIAQGNIEKLESVFSNLIDNAIRHCEQGDSILVTIGKQSNSLLVSIKDTGLGISEEDLPKIFDRHFRASNSAKGKGANSGLGLAISSRILTLHGSNLKVTSCLGEGTEFSFQLSFA